MQSLISFLSQPIIIGEIVIALMLLILGVSLQAVKLREKKGKKQTRFSLAIDYMMESVYGFFEDILWEKAPFRIKSYVTNLFVVILLANILWLILDIIVYPFPWMEYYIQAPTGDLTFTLALAIVSIVLVLVVEAKTKGLFKFFYNYVPIFWKRLIKIEKGSIPKIAYYAIVPIVKLFDIVISLFMAILDIIGIIAKVISLAFRLYGNMMAGSILIGMIVVMLGQAVKNRIGIEFPFLVPLIFYLQSTLTAVVQAFVFGLLTSVFIKMSLEEEDTKQKKKSEDTLQQQLAQSIQREVIS